MKKKEKIKKERPLYLKWIFALIPLALALILYFVMPYFPFAAEYIFAQGIYRIVSFPIEWIVSVFPFSLTELVVILAVPALITLLIIFIRRLIKSQNKGKTAEKAARFICWCLSIFLLVFMITDGVNFSRYSVGDLVELPS